MKITTVLGRQFLKATNYFAMLGKGTQEQPYLPIRAIGGPDGRQLAISEFGGALVEGRDLQINANFAFDIPDDYTTVTPGSSTITVSDGMAILTADGSNIPVLTSKHRVRYRSGVQSFVGGTLLVETGGGYFWAGDAAGYNGFYIKITTANGIEEIGRVFDGTATATLKADFNGDDLSGIDPTKLNIFGISYGYYGVLAPTFEVLEVGTYSPLKIHTDWTHGVLTRPHIGVPYLPCSVHPIANGVIKTASQSGWNQGGKGKDFLGRKVGSYDAYTAVGDTSAETILVAFRSAPTYKGKENPIAAVLTDASFSTDLDGEIVIRFRGVPASAVTNSPTWLYSDTGTGTENRSIMQYSTDATITLASTRKILPTFLAGAKAAAGVGGRDFSGSGLEAFAGDIFCITAQRLSGTTSYNVGHGYTWGERF